MKQHFFGRDTGQYVRCPVLFADFLFTVTNCKRMMSVDRRREVEDGLQTDLVESGIKQVGAAHHVGNMLAGVVPGMVLSSTGTQ